MQVNQKNVVNFMDFERDARADIGYKKPEKPVQARPNIPWAQEVFQKKEVRQPQESPLKQWWLAEEAKKRSLQE